MQPKPICPPPLTKQWFEELFPDGFFAKLKSVTVGEACLTPAASEVILATRNTHNRPISLTQQRFLSRVITKGEYIITGETLIFDSNGIMINGQHRCAAVRASGLPVPVLLVIGVDPSAFRYIDQHKKRTFSQVLSICGEKHATTLAGACAKVHCFLAGHQTFGQSDLSITIDDLSFTLDHSARLRDSVALFRAHTAGFFPSPTLGAALHFLFSSVNPTAADTFWSHLLQISVPSHGHWSALHLLLKRLAKHHQNKKKEHIPAAFLAALTVKAWNAFMAGDTVRVLKWTEQEEYPAVFGWTLTQNGHVCTPMEWAHGEAAH